MRPRTPRWARCGLLLAAAISFGCAGGLQAPPDKGGPVWSRLESEHFALYSDLDARSARDTIHMFERLLDAYYELGWEAQGKLPVKLHVVLFADRSDFDVFGSGVEGYHVRLRPFEPLVVMPDHGRLDSFHALKHELTHYIAFQALPFQPRWFAEGLAGYFQTAYFDDKQQFVVGDPPRDLLAVLGAMRRLRTADLLANEPTAPTLRFYATSWLLVHYLMSHHGDAFVKYQDGLAEGRDHDAAWAAAFPALQFERLDAVLTRYYTEGAYRYYTRPVLPHAGSEPRVTVLSSADVYALRAQLYFSCSRCSPDASRLARENTAAALRLEPRHLRASVMHIASEPREKRLALANALAQAHPNAALAWMLRGSTELASTRPHRCTPEASARLRELGRGSAHALMLAATCQAAAGEKQDALELSTRALRQQPADSGLLLMQAAILDVVGDCAGLRRLMLRLSNATHALVAPQEIAKLDARCRAAAPQPP